MALFRHRWKSPILHFPLMLTPLLTNGMCGEWIWWGGESLLNKTIMLYLPFPSHVLFTHIVLNNWTCSFPRFRSTFCGWGFHRAWCKQPSLKSICMWWIWHEMTCGLVWMNMSIWKWLDIRLPAIQLSLLDSTWAGGWCMYIITKLWKWVKARQGRKRESDDSLTSEMM